MNREALITGFNFEDCGSCALLAIITNTRIFIANSGDSQGVIIGSRARCLQIDQSATQHQPTL